jgi:hypothetical protein
MWPLKVPMRKASDSYQACVARSTKAEGRRERLLKAADTVQKAGQALREAAAARNLHDLDAKGLRFPRLLVAPSWIGRTRTACRPLGGG